MWKYPLLSDISNLSISLTEKEMHTFRNSEQITIWLPRDWLTQQSTINGKRKMLLKTYVGEQGEWSNS